MKVLLVSVLLLSLSLSGCAIIEACQASPGACTGGGSEVIRVNGKVYKIERDVL